MDVLRRHGIDTETPCRMHGQVCAARLIQVAVRVVDCVMEPKRYLHLGWMFGLRAKVGPPLETLCQVLTRVIEAIRLRVPRDNVREHVVHRRRDLNAKLSPRPEPSFKHAHRIVAGEYLAVDWVHSENPGDQDFRGSSKVDAELFCSR